MHCIYQILLLSIVASAKCIVSQLGEMLMIPCALKPRKSHDMTMISSKPGISNISKSDTHKHYIHLVCPETVNGQRDTNETTDK